MNNHELKEYIKDYLKNDQTNRALMLTGDWGVGKSYFLSDDDTGLVNEINKLETKDDPSKFYKCCVISLYGISELSDISRKIFWQLHFGKKALSRGISVTSTLASMAAGVFNVDFSKTDKVLKELYADTNLKNVLLIFEDLERCNISLIEVMGFINSLVEQDKVKVLIVSNESQLGLNDEEQKKKYALIKEKTIGDTIKYKGDRSAALGTIAKKFENGSINKCIGTDGHLLDFIESAITQVMTETHCYSLRVYMYGCQKANNILTTLAGTNLSDSFIYAIFIGIIAYVLRKNGEEKNTEWEGHELYSQEFGTGRYPLFRFCYEYINEQSFNIEDVAKCAEVYQAFLELRHREYNDDPDLRIIMNYEVQNERDVTQALHHVYERLGSSKPIPYSDFGPLADKIVQIRMLGIGNDIDFEKKFTSVLGVKKGILRPEDIFPQGLPDLNVQNMTLQLRMVMALQDEQFAVPGFEYHPNELVILKQYIKDNIVSIRHDDGGFINKMDVPPLVEMFLACNAEQLNEFREIITLLYDIKGHETTSKHFLEREEYAFRMFFTELKNNIRFEKVLNDENEDKIKIYQRKELMSTWNGFFGNPYTLSY